MINNLNNHRIYTREFKEEAGVLTKTSGKTKAELERDCLKK